MTAPDKIYVEIRHPFGNEFTEIVGFENKGNSEDIEYISKDALLEWAKFVLKCQEEELAKYDGPSYMKASTMGRIDAYKVLIAKLNSM